jgi:hypothetical protein
MSLLDNTATIEHETQARLREIYDFLTSFVVFTNDSEALAVTLWVAHTYLMDAIDTTPRLVIRSPEKQAGKSRVLEVLKLLCPTPVLSHNVSAAYITRKIASGRPTLLLDEYDTIFLDTSDKSETLRSILNAGYETGSTYGRVDKTMAPVDMPAFAAVALAGIGNPPDTIADRAVVINMRRKTKAEKVQRFRKRIVRPQGLEISGRAAAWSKRALEVFDLEGTEIPEDISDRQADIWEPLLAIADLAGVEWGNAARIACRVMTTAQAIDDTDSGKALRLLRDTRSVFGDEERLATEELLRRLRVLDESEWAGQEYGEPVLNARKLADMLRPYAVRPVKWYVNRACTRGYKRCDFVVAWEHWLPITIGSMLAEANGVEILDEAA